jgi:choline dehydrogenase-like flavoprotein
MTTHGQVDEVVHVVVGGDSAGAAIAARLSEDTTRSLTLLEAGYPYESNGCIEVLQSRVHAASDETTPIGAV